MTHGTVGSVGTVRVVVFLAGKIEARPVLQCNSHRIAALRGINTVKPEGDRRDRRGLPVWIIQLNHQLLLHLLRYWNLKQVGTLVVIRRPEQQPVARFKFAAVVRHNRIRCAAVYPNHVHSHAAVFPLQPMIRAEAGVVAHTDPQHPLKFLLVAVGLRQRGKLCRSFVVPRVNTHDCENGILRDEHGLERKHEILRRGRYARI